MLVARRHRKKHRDRRAAARLRCDRHGAARLLREPIHHAEAEPCAAAAGLRGEERLERAADDVGRHPAPGVFERERRVRSRLQVVVGGPRLGHRADAGADRERAAVGHRIARVQRHVQHRRFERRWIHERHARVGDRHGLDANGRAERAAQKPDDALDERVDVDRLRIQEAAPRERQQVAGEVSAVHRRAKDGVDDLVGVRIVRQIRSQQLDVAEDDREDVVEVVRDAAGQLADGFHLLRSEQRFARLLQRLVRLLQLGDVVRDAVEAQNLSVLVAVDALRHEIRLPRAALAGRDAFERLRLPGGEHLTIRLEEAARGLFGIQLEVALADDLGRRFSDEAGERLVDEDVTAVEILDEDRVGRRFDDRLQNVVAVGNRHRVRSE